MVNGPFVAKVPVVSNCPLEHDQCQPPCILYSACMKIYGELGRGWGCEVNRLVDVTEVNRRLNDDGGREGRREEEGDHSR